jgi:hypothetical protein
MNPALATWAPGPPWLGWVSAVPRTVPPASAAVASLIRGPGGGVGRRLSR